MNRRHFTRIAAAMAGLFALPLCSGVVTQGIADASKRDPEKTTRLRIGSHTTRDLREENRVDRLGSMVPTSLDPPDDDNNYWAEAIEDGGKFYYRAKGVTIAIEEDEFRLVVENPSLYYFSTALKLHFRIERARSGDVIPS